MKFVRNAWYVAGWASEFGPDLKRATILGDDVVLYRTGEGKVAAVSLNAIGSCGSVIRGRLRRGA